MDLLDCAILDWIKAMCNSTSKKIIAQRVDGWTWIDYSQLLRDMPLLRIRSKGAITPRIKRIVENNYIETDLKDGEKLFAKLTEKVDKLEFDSVHDTKRYRSRTRTPTVHENEPIILLTNNHITKSSSGDAPRDEDKEKNKGVSEIIGRFEILNESSKKFFNNTTQRKAAEELLGKDMRKIIKAIYLAKFAENDRFFPTVTKPTELLDKWPKVLKYYKSRVLSDRKYNQDFEAYMVEMERQRNAGRPQKKVEINLGSRKLEYNITEE